MAVEALQPCHWQMLPCVRICLGDDNDRDLDNMKERTWLLRVVAHYPFLSVVVNENNKEKYGSGQK